MSKAIRGLTGHVGFFKPLKNTSLGPLEKHFWRIGWFHMQ